MVFHINNHQKCPYPFSLPLSFEIASYQTAFLFYHCDHYGELVQALFLGELHDMLPRIRSVQVELQLVG